LAQARLDAFLPDLARPINNQSNRLTALGRREEALAAVDQALRLVVPLLERAPYVLPNAGLELVQTYRDVCGDPGHEPDREVMQWMDTVPVSTGGISVEHGSPAQSDEHSMHSISRADAGLHSSARQ
jgi:hypothetical protein